MIPIELNPRFLRSLKKIRPDLTDEAERRLAQVANDFGKPHAHSGLGLRKLEPRAYEVRLGLHYRLILLHREKRLIAFDILTHEEVRQWLRSK